MSAASSDDETAQRAVPLEDENNEPAVDDHQTEFSVLGVESFEKLKKINVTCEWVKQAQTFPAELEGNSLPVSEIKLPVFLQQEVLHHVANWFPVQKAVLPLLLEQIQRPPPIRPRDIAIAAPTGSGKTMCYVLPILACVGSHSNGRTLALIVVPVQTLVTQIEQEFAKFNKCADVLALSGNITFEKECRRIAALARSPDVIISTPMRLMEHLTNMNSTIDISGLRYLVVDEADRMGNMFRLEWLNTIEKRCGNIQRAVNLRDTLTTHRCAQKILLSATLSKDVEQLHLWNLHRPILFRAFAENAASVDLATMNHISGGLSLPSSIKHNIVQSELRLFPLIVHKIIKKRKFKKVLVFTNERDAAMRLSYLLNGMAEGKYYVENFTADIIGPRRSKVLSRFKSGKTRVLICSDVLSRGVDVADVDCVFNYDTPTNDRLFTHRAGRTGRAGRSGDLVSLCGKKSKRLFVKMLQKTGLWMNVEESIVEESELSDMMDAYKKALESLQVKMAHTETQTRKQTKTISGFAFPHRKRRYAHGTTN